MAFFKKHKIKFLSLAMFLLLPFFIIGLVFLGTDVVYGQLPSGATGLFGGKLLGTIQCTCTGGHVMIIGPPRAARVLLLPGFSRVFEYGQTKSIGAWQLGIYAPPGICLRRISDICIPIPHDGIVSLIGTSR